MAFGVALAADTQATETGTVQVIEATFRQGLSAGWRMTVDSFPGRHGGEGELVRRYTENMAYIAILV